LCGSVWQEAQATGSAVYRTAVPLPAGNVPVSFLWHAWQSAFAWAATKKPLFFSL
jgi:hypothetical protein